MMPTEQEPREVSPFSAAFRDEYSPVAVRGSWLGVASLAFFASALFARFLVGFAVPSGTGYFRRAILSSLAVPLLATIGLLFGLVGSRVGGRSGAARLGMWLNLIVVVLGSLLVAAFYWILPDNWTPLPTR